MVSASSAGASAGASVSVVSSTTSSGAAGASVDSSSVAPVSVAVSSVSGVVASVDVVSSAVSSVVTSSVPVAASVPVASSVPVPSVSIVSVIGGLSARPSAMPSAIAWTLEDCITMAMVRTATSATFHLFIVWRRVALWPSRLSLIQTTIPSCLGRRPTTPACLHVVRGQSAPTAHFGVTVTQKAVGGIFLFCLLNSTLGAF